MHRLAPVWVFQNAKVPNANGPREQPHGSPTRHTHALARAHTHTAGLLQLTTPRKRTQGWTKATGRGKYGKHTGPGRSTGKKIDTSPFWCNEPPVRDIATTKEKDHITLHRHLRKRLDFYPGEARARRYNTGPPPVPPDMAGGLSAFAVQ